MTNSISWKATRPVVLGRHGAVASAHPLASQAGLDMLRTGGNAVDAVVAAASTLGVVEPYMSGPGGVGFLLLHVADGTTKVLNFSGNTPAAATADRFTPDETEIGPKACLIPGNIAGWFEALRAHGTKQAADVFAPAIRFAEEGFPLHPFNVDRIAVTLPRLNPAGKDVFESVPNRLGAVLRQPDLAESYRRLCASGPDEFYKGPLGNTVCDFLQSQGGLLSRDDLAGYQPEWDEPISVDYRGINVRTCPPNNEGFQILQTLKLIEGFDLVSLGHNSAEYIHLLSEAMKLAVADRIEHSGDPKFDPVPLDRLLSDDYTAARRKQINPMAASQSEGERWRGLRAADVVSPGRIDGLTTHLSAVDAAGNVASITQSLGNGFGSGVMVPGTGILLNNFIWWTEIDRGCHKPSRIEPGKRWSCCMAPVQVHRDGKFWFSIATPGSWGILQTTTQMLLNIVEFGADPQMAIEAPRFRLWEETRMQIEDRVDPSVRAELESRGHALELLDAFSVYVGGGQSVMIDPKTGTRLAGADPRRDGYALAY